MTMKKLKLLLFPVLCLLAIQACKPGPKEVVRSELFPKTFIDSILQVSITGYAHSTTDLNNVCVLGINDSICATTIRGLNHAYQTHYRQKSDFLDFLYKALNLKMEVDFRNTSRYCRYYPFVKDKKIVDLYKRYGFEKFKDTVSYYDPEYKRYRLKDKYYHLLEGTATIEYYFYLNGYVMSINSPDFYKIEEWRSSLYKK